MALQAEDIAAQNPWWSEPAVWEPGDAHLRRLAEKPIRLPAEVVERIPFDAPSIHTLRGPRQVGKSTDLKLLVERALREGRTARGIVYLSFDLLHGEPLRELAAAVRTAKRLSRHDGPHLVLLDEVTVVEGWEMAVKDLYDQGDIDRDVVVCTGSSSYRLRVGAVERLPGRRGEGHDWLVLPQPFSSFAGAVDTSVPDSPRLSPAEMMGEAGRAILAEHEIFLPRLRAALDLYLRFGGLPVAVAEAAGGRAEPSEAARRVLYDSLLREVQRERVSEPALRALLERMLRSLGSKTSWTKLGEEMGGLRVGSGARGSAVHHNTVRHYVELLAGSYFVLVAYFWRRDSDTNSLSRDKKLYFADPMLHTLAHELAPRLPFDEPALVENAVGMALYRRHEPLERQIETFASPERLHIWETSRGNEVDFVCGPFDDVAAVEVRYRARAERRKVHSMRRAFPGRPVVMVTRDEMELGDGYALIPAALFLWALG